MRRATRWRPSPIGATFAGSSSSSWNGRDSAGAVVPDGPYKLRLHLETGTRRSPSRTRSLVKTSPALIEIRSVRPARLLAGPRRPHRVRHGQVHGLGDGTALLYVNGERVARGRLTRSAGSLHWFGHGENYPPGIYRLSLRAEDRAGNISPPDASRRVLLRSVSLGRNVVDARPGARFAVRVSSDAELVHWRLRGHDRRRGAPARSASARRRSRAVPALRHRQRAFAGRSRGRVAVTAELATGGRPDRHAPASRSSCSRPDASCGSRGSG